MRNVAIPPYEPNPEWLDPVCPHDKRGRCELTSDFCDEWHQLCDFCNYHSDDWEYGCERYIREHGVAEE